MNENKEELKLNIQKIFTQLRNLLNNREDELLLEVDKKYNKLFLNEQIFNQTQKMPTKIKESLEKGKLIQNEWSNNRLNSLINDCLNIENNINSIKSINESIKQYNSFNIQIYFFPDKDGIKLFSEEIKKFGNIQGNLFNSKIDFDQSLVYSWLNNKNFTSELLFRKTRDGSTPEDFHNKCDNKGTTITFIETTNGYKFGGYTEIEWDCSNQYKSDKQTFLFSFNKRNKYTSKRKGYLLACDKNSGPRFGHDEIYLYKTLDKGQIPEVKNPTFISDRQFTNGEEYWDIKELEVFKINYI